MNKFLKSLINQKPIGLPGKTNTKYPSCAVHYQSWLIILILSSGVLISSKTNEHILSENCPLLSELAHSNKLS